MQAQSRPGRAWIVVSVPADGNQKEVAATMDAARALVAEADAGERAPAAAQAEGIVHDWWARRRESAPRRPISKFGVRADRNSSPRSAGRCSSRWPWRSRAVALPSGQRRSEWIFPAVVALLLVAVVVADRAASESAGCVRALSLAFIVVLVAEAAQITARLIVDLVEGGPETNSAKDLLSVGFGVWLYTILAFSFVYWILDGGGPDARLWAPREYPNLAFPEQFNPVVAPPGWRPLFFDCRYCWQATGQRLTGADKCGISSQHEIRERDRQLPPG